MIRHVLLLVIGLVALLGQELAAQTEGVVLERRYFYKQGIVGVFGIDGEFNPGRYKWSILTPSQDLLPGLPAYVDPNRIVPFPETSQLPGTSTFSALVYQGCSESDQCEFSFQQTNASAAKRLVIRLAGIRAPHIKASCEQETLLGRQAQQLIHGFLSSAVHIELISSSIDRREIVGRLVADDQDLSELLVSQGLAIPLREGKRDWCS
ncbi:thermonuclease family protein [Nitrospira sp. T9]|uniref:thermonuclease family protein n=1 Tax=unclassified Nitrospira TaxID=2652172 RepID=UPI003F95C2ED